MIAALYVERDGVYSGRDDVDVWDETRDARTYPGPYPVVAHPPCNKWSPLAYLNQQRIPGYRRGDDGGCFAAALEAVRTWGGVLEHPAGSGAWTEYGLPQPPRYGWQGGLWDDGYSTEVSQAAYGHRARKRTWLYAFRCRLPIFDWSEPVRDAIVSGFLHRKGTDETRRVRPLEAAATPVAFAELLLEMARSVTPA